MAVDVDTRRGPASGEETTDQRRLVDRARLLSADPRLGAIIWWTAAVVLVGLRLITAIHRGPAMHDGDVTRFHRLGLAEGRPYVDYHVEYPIGTFGLLRVLAWFAPDRVAFGHIIVWMAFAADIVLAAVLFRFWGRGAAMFQLVAGMFLAHLLDARVDLLAAVIAVVALVAWEHRHSRLAGTLFAVGAAVKLWPAMLALVVAGSRTSRDSRRLLWAFAVVGGVIGAVWLAIGGLGGPIQVLTFRDAKGWEIESTVGAFVRLFHSGIAHAEQGAFRLGVASHAVTLAIWAVALPLAIWSAWEGGRTQRLGLGWIASVGILLLGSSLLSPQFLIWLLPGAAIAWAERERLIPLLIAVASAMTGREMHDFDPMIRGDRDMVVWVILRNAVLLAATALAVVRIVRARRQTMDAAEALLSSTPEVVARTAR